MKPNGESLECSAIIRHARLSQFVKIKLWHVVKG